MGDQPAWAGYRLQTGDFDGDGKTDILGIGVVDAYDRYTGSGCLFIRYGGRYLPYQVNWACNQTAWANYTFQVGDFDADGRSDVLGLGYMDTYGRYSGSGCLFVRSGGSSLPNQVNWTCNQPSWTNYTFQVGDFDADGRSDMLGLGYMDTYGRYSGSGVLLVRY